MKRLHTPFDAVELASDAVARGNLKVFEEIGLGVRALALDGRLRRRGAAAAVGVRGVRATRIPERVLFGNLCIGLHEQTRLQPEITEALDAPYVTAEDLGRRVCGGHGPAALHRLVGRVVAPAQGKIAELSREAITHSLMVARRCPAGRLSLGVHLPGRGGARVRERRARRAGRALRAGGCRRLRRSGLVVVGRADALHLAPVPGVRRVWRRCRRRRSRTRRWRRSWRV